MPSSSLLGVHAKASLVKVSHHEKAFRKAQLLQTPSSGQVWRSYYFQGSARLEGTLIFFVGEYYEYSLKGTEVHEKKYYGKEVMRLDGVLYFILTDHLGSTSIVTDGNGVKLVEQRYDAWGVIRYSNGTSPTDKLYTGQRLSADLNLYDYKARWYDPYAWLTSGS